MLLKSLKMKDFRQFNGEQKIEFSVDKDQNVTIIMGENGAGKTTFAQAFKWCFYGNTILDGVLLSQELQNKMYPGDENYVEVIVELIHHGQEYTVKRRLKYKKNTSGQVVTGGQPDFTIMCKGEDGNQSTETNPVLKMKDILPEELSGYFFFDGEHIEAMSKEISTRSRSSDIRDAVKNLLGLKAYDKALEHLNQGRGSVIGSLLDMFDGDADSEIGNLRTEIGELSDRLDEINKQLETLADSTKVASDKIQELDIRIAKNSSSKELAVKRANLERKLKELENAKMEQVGRFLKIFNKNGPRFFATRLIHESLLVLKTADKLDTGIPDVTASTINFLFNRKKCICGEHLEAGEEHYDRLYKLLDSIPPKSLGSLIREFATACEEKTRDIDMVMTDFEEKFRFLRDYDNSRTEYEEDLKTISEQLKDIEDVSALEDERNRYSRKLRELSDNRDSLNQEKGEKESRKSALEERCRVAATGNQKNAEIETYKTYATYVYNSLKETYDEKEAETRQRLAMVIDEIFRQIYDGDFSLSLDEKYNIEVTPQLQTSTGQSVAIILAFIAGVIKMARDNSQKDGDLTTSEPYPLVMDAPLSAFDLKRIETVCNVLPEIAEQVIIFIKDTDGEYAEKYLSHKIGAHYRLDMISQTRTDLLQGVK